MKQGYLSQYFKGAAGKFLSLVEVDVLTSHQHEFNGVEGLRNILGEPIGKVKYDAKFLYLTDTDENFKTDDGFFTWYDARQKAREERGVMRYEYRLYFPTNAVTLAAKAGDLLVIAKKPNDTLLAIVAEKDSTIARQMMWLFGFQELTEPGFSIRENLESEHDRIEFASRFILETIGISVEVKADSWLDYMIKNFGNTFPKTREFSAYARSTLPDIDITDNQDETLMAWMEREEILFRAFEKHLISERLSQGFNDDVDGFIAYSLSVQNRRKSRAGFALENHLEHLFNSIGIKYSRTAVTENKAKPDFIFPGIKEYHSREFNPLLLTMLGVKSSCKDRWRQVLSEADRIDKKHLLTLEAAISKNQTDEMISKNLQLVLPKALHQSYSSEQQTWLMDITSFSNLVLERQKKI